MFSRCALLVPVLVLVQGFLLATIQCGPVEQKIHFSEEKIAAIKNLAENMSSMLSSSINPCDDFFTYACQKSNSSEVSFASYEEINAFMEEYFEKNDLPEAEKKLKDYVTSCKTTSKDHLKEFIKEFQLKSIGEWPAFNSAWNGDQFNWQDAVAELHPYSTKVVYSINFRKKEGFDFNRYVSIGVKSFDLFDEKKQKDMRETLTQLGVNNVDEIIGDAVQFEEECKKALAACDLSDENVLETDIDGLKKLIPEIDWVKMIEILSGRKISDHFPVVVKNSDAIKSIATVVSKTDPKTVVNYFFCVFVDDLPGIPDPEDCHSVLYYLFEPIVTGIVMKRYFKDNDKAVIREMLHFGLKNIHEYFDVISTIPADEIPTAEELLSDEYFAMFSDESLAERYQDVEIDENKYMCNYMALHRHHKMRIANIFANDKLDIIKLLRQLLDPIFPVFSIKIQNEPSAFVYKDTVFHFLSDYVHFVGEPEKIRGSWKECLPEDNTMGEVDEIHLGAIGIVHVLTKGYFEWIDHNKDITLVENEILKDYGLSNKKMLLLWLVQLGCDKKTPETTNVVNFVMSHAFGFADLYNCPVGSTMNPKHLEKCKI